MTVPVITEDLTIKVRAIERDLHFVKEVTDADLGDNIIYNYHITTGSVTSDSIANATITGGDIASATIVGSNIANGTITGTQIGNAVISGTHIGSGTITGSNIASATITGGNIGSGTITGTNMATASITSDHITNATITGSDIGTATITGDNIAAATITSGHLGSLAITSAMIVDLTITADDIASSTITAAKIANNTITATQIANNTITATQILANTITATQIANQTITATQIANNTITATQLLNNTITAGQIANNTITAGQIANNTITSGQIASNTITAGNILDLTITASEIADLSITGAKIVAGTLDASKITVTSLSALSANMGTITAGTITGATFQSATTDPRFIADSTGIRLRNSAGLITFNADTSTGKITTLAGIGGFNLVKNSSAEDPAINESQWYTDGVGGWWLQDIGTSKFTRQVRTDTKHGNYCFKVNRTSGTGSVGLVQDHDPVAFGPAREGEVFSASAHFQSYVGSGHDAQVWIQFLSSGLGHIAETSSASVPVSTSSWTRVYLDNVTAPAGTAYVRFKAFGFNLAVNNEILIDACQLEQGPISTYYSPSPYDILPNAVQTWQQNTELQPGLVGTFWRTDGTASPPVENGPPIFQEVRTQPGLEHHNYSPGGTGTTNWTVRYTGYVKNKNFNGNVTFYVYTDDGARIRVNGQTLVGDNAWINQAVTKYGGAINLTANQYYPIVVEHYQGASAEDFYLAWESGGWGEELVPAANLFHGGSIGAAQIPPETVTSGTIAAKAVLADSVATDAITTRALAANSVAAENIAANAVSARSLAVGALSDNLITNWSAEGGSTDGWAVVENSGSPATLATYANTGAHGSQIFGLQAQGGGNTAYGYRAVPVIPGRKYMFKFFIFHDNGTGTHYVRMNERSSYPPTGDHVTASNRTSSTDFIAGAANSTISSGWQQKEYVYTAPAGITYVSASFYNWGGTTGTLHFDAVEFREQVRGVAIADGAITADKLVIGATGWDRVMVRGSNQEAAILGNTGGRLYINNVLVNSASSTGLTVSVYNRTTHAAISHTSYSNYFNDTASDNMASALNALGSDRVVMIYSNDAWGPPTTNLKAAMRRCGASSAIDKPTGSRSSYALIGWPGMGEGNGLEQAGKNPASPTDWYYAEANAQWVDGEIQGANTGLTGSTVIYGGNIAADAIDGKTITGATLRTAATGSRVNIDTTGIKAYNATTETLRISSSDGSSALSMPSTGFSAGVPQLANPSATSNASNWTIDGGGGAPTFIRDTADFNSTPASFSLTTGAIQRGVRSDAISGTFTSGKKYGLKIWIKWVGAFDPLENVIIQFGDIAALDTAIHSINAWEISASGGFTPFLVDWTPTANRTAVQVYVVGPSSGFGGTPATHTIRFDTLEIVDLSIPPYQTLKFEDPIGSNRRGDLVGWNLDGEDNAHLALEARPDPNEVWDSTSRIAVFKGDAAQAEAEVVAWQKNVGTGTPKHGVKAVVYETETAYHDTRAFNIIDSQMNSDFMLDAGYTAATTRTTTQSIPNATWTPIAYTETVTGIWDVESEALGVGQINGSNGLIVNNPGVYIVNMQCSLDDTSGGGSYRAVRIRGSMQTAVLATAETWPRSAVVNRLNATGLCILRKNEVVTAEIYQDSGGSRNVFYSNDAPNILSMCRLSSHIYPVFGTK